MEPERITIWRGGAIGDVVLTLPAIFAMREAYPHARLRLIGSPSPLCLVHPDEILDHNHAALAPLHGPSAPLPQTTRDLFVPTEQLLVYAVDPDGVLRTNLRSLLQDRVVLHDPRPGSDTHITAHLLAPVRALGIPIHEPVPRIQIQNPWRTSAQNILRQHNLHSPFAIVHPGSGGRRKCWPMDRFLTLAHELFAQGVCPLLLYGPAETDLLPHLERGRPPGSIIMPSPDLHELAALLSLADLFVGNDTGPAHIAASVGTPTISLFGPTDPSVWAHPSAHVIQAPGGDLSSLDVAPVLDAALAALERSNTR